MLTEPAVGGSYDDVAVSTKTANSISGKSWCHALLPTPKEGADELVRRAEARPNLDVADDV
ncbi:hypothetical protein CHS0354_032112, partial [Potamilus streckersoni]